ncbi:hypothetical protein R9R82_000695 [Campylobacter jejuni]|nr:hypothetical protein [Campylobacter jejuni]
MLLNILSAAPNIAQVFLEITSNNGELGTDEEKLKYYLGEQKRRKFVGGKIKFPFGKIKLP